ncbi:MAG: beta-propeller fold lactonase family protein [Opitutales bacterium]
MTLNGPVRDCRVTTCSKSNRELTKSVAFSIPRAQLFTLLACLLGAHSLLEAQITIRTEGRSHEAYKDFMYHWDGSEIKFYGDELHYVADEDIDVPASGTTFSSPALNDTYGYRLEAVEDWNSEDAQTALARGDFQLYLKSRNPALVDGHRGNIYGYTVYSEHDQSGYLGLGAGYPGHPERIGTLGEALILTVDTQGDIQADPNTSAFFGVNVGSDAGYTFTNIGLSADSQLVISDLHLGRFTSRDADVAVDFFVFDVSENRLISGPGNGSAMGLKLTPDDLSTSTIPGPWKMDHGDIIVLAHSVRDGVTDPTGFWDLWSLKMDITEREPIDDYKLYLGSRPRDEAATNSLQVYSIDPTTGTLSLVNSRDRHANVWHLGTSPSPEFDNLYLSSNNTGIAAYSIDDTFGSVEFIEEQLDNPSNGEQVNTTYVSVSPSGNLVVTANFFAHRLTVYSRNSDGSLTDPIQQIQFGDNSDDLHAAYFSNSGEYLFVANTGNDEIIVYAVDEAATQPLTQTQSISTGLDSGPRHMVINSSDTYLYVVETGSGEIELYSHNQGTLTHVETYVSHNVTDASIRPGADILMSSDGQFLYANNRRGDDTLSIFDIDPNDGTLSNKRFVTLPTDSNSTAIDLDPTENFLFVTCTAGGTLETFSRDSATGDLSYLPENQISGLDRPYSLVIPDKSFQRRDKNPPEVSFAASTPATLNVGYTDLSIWADVLASENAIYKVSLYLDGALILSDAETPYQFITDLANPDDPLARLPIGEYVFKLVSTDIYGGQGIAEKQIEVIDPEDQNLPPQVSVVKSYTSENGAHNGGAFASIIINAEDPDGTIKSVELFNGSNSVWEFTTQRQDSPYYIFDSAQDGSASALNNNSGSHTFTIVATDNDGLTSSVDHTIQYTNPSNGSYGFNDTPRPRILASSTTNVVQGDEITIATSTEERRDDENIFIDSVELFVNGVSAGVGQPSNQGGDFSFTFSSNGTGSEILSNLGAGFYTLEMKATDTDGAFMITFMHLEVAADPTQTLAIALPNNTPEEVDMSYTSLAFEPTVTGPVSNVEMYLNDQLVGSIDTSPYSFNSTDFQDLGTLELGTYDLEFIVYDSENNQASVSHQFAVTTDLPVVYAERVRDGTEGLANEGRPRIGFYLTEALDEDLVLSLRHSGTATPGEDYSQGETMNITIQAGQTFRNITYNTTQDSEVEGEERIQATILQNSNYVTVPRRDSAVARLADDDTYAPGPGFSNEFQSDTPGTVLAEIPYLDGFDPNNPSDQDSRARSILIDYFNGYMFVDSRFVRERGTNTERNARIAYDISDLSNIREVSYKVSTRPQHTASILLPHHRFEASPQNVSNISNPLDIVAEDPPGYNLYGTSSRSNPALPYIYDGGSTIEIYDARISNEADALLATLDAHGFEAQAIPIGNLLIAVGIRGQDLRAVATYDISDPAEPFLLDKIENGSSQWITESNGRQDDRAYETFIWNNFIILPNSNRGNDAEFVDFSNPRDLQVITKIGSITGNSRYAQFQDNKMFLGDSTYDLSPLRNDPPEDPIKLDGFNSNGPLHEHFGEYMLPLGNLYVAAENTRQGANGRNQPIRFFAHEQNADSTRPQVTFHLPESDAENVPLTSRIGLIIHETLDYATINSSSLLVYPEPAEGEDPESITGSINISDKDILNFTPDIPLQKHTKYFVSWVVDEDQGIGIKDVSGNYIVPDSFSFTTIGDIKSTRISLETPTSSIGYPLAVNDSPSLEVIASGGEGVLRYNWDFGDGTSSGYSADNFRVSHTYTQTGRFEARVTVIDEENNFATESIFLTVADDIVESQMPSKSSQIILDKANRLVWCVNPDNDTISAINADTLIKVKEFSVGADPRSIALDDNGYLWVTCIDADRLEKIDPVSGALVDSLQFPYGARPSDIVFMTNYTYGFVSLSGSGEIIRFDPDLALNLADTHIPPRQIPTATALAIVDNLEILTSRFISPDSGGEVYTFNQIQRADRFTQVNGNDHIITITPDTTSPDDGSQARGIANYLSDIAISPTENHAYVIAKKDNIFAGTRSTLDTPTPLLPDTSIRTMIAKIDLSTKLEDVESRIDIDDSSQPSAIAFSDVGEFFFVALQGDNSIHVFDDFRGVKMGSFFDENAFAPQGLVFDQASARLFVKNLNSRDISVFNLSEALLTRNFTNTHEATIDVVQNDFSKFSEEVLTGKRIFYDAKDNRMSGNDYISCAACHQDGDHDGRVWDFTQRGEGMRNTTNLRGRAGMAHGNVHWSANFDEIQDFELDIVNHFGGDGFIEDLGAIKPDFPANAGRSEDLDALAAYVASLGKESVEKSPHREADGSLTMEALRGKQLFEGLVLPVSGEQLNCVACHKPTDEFTNSLPVPGQFELFDVGTLTEESGQRLSQETLTGVDTPTLWGLHASAPYLHHGGAATIEDVFNFSGSESDPNSPDINAHDVGTQASRTHTLNSTEFADLIAYLEQIDGRGEGAVSYEIWRQLWGQDIGAESLDFDGDSISNFNEFIYGLNPTVADTSERDSLPNIVIDRDSHYFEFMRRTNNTNLDYTVTTSTDLHTWQPIDLSNAASEDVVDSIQNVSVDITPGNEEKRFYRLEVSETP